MTDLVALDSTPIPVHKEFRVVPLDGTGLSKRQPRRLAAGLRNRLLCPQKLVQGVSLLPIHINLVLHIGAADSEGSFLVL